MSASTTPIAVQVWSIASAFVEDPEVALTRVAELGFTAVELFGLPDRVAETERALRNCGLVAPSAHASLVDRSDDHVRSALDAALTLGVRTLIEPAIRDGWETVDGRHWIAEQLNALADAGRRDGIDVGYHNHWWEFGDAAGPSAFDAVVAELSPDVALEVDVFWAQVGGVDAPELVARWGERVRFLHIKDGPLSLDASTQRPAGQGDLDIGAVLAAAPNATRVLEFDAYAGDIFDGLAQSRAFVLDADVAKRHHSTYRPRSRKD